MADKREGPGASDNGEPDEARQAFDMREGEGAEGGDAGGPAADADDAPSQDPGDCYTGPPVVAVGASAGGLEALGTFLEGLVSTSGAAYVLLTHQHRGHVSMLSELLGRHTTLPIADASDGMRLQPDRVYVAPAGTVEVVNGCFAFSDSDASPKRPVDRLFQSVAQECGRRSAAVVLSGTGTDGTVGVREVKLAGGLILAQDDASAQYSGMPQSAVAAGVVDLVLPPERMGSRIAEFLSAVDAASGVTDDKQVLTKDLQKIFMLLRGRCGHDFSSYKPSTIRRRVERRMGVHGIDTYRGYVRLLQEDVNEVDLLFKELLIGVTSFFRDPEAFDILLDRVLVPLLEEADDGEQIRVWVAGCSTGEEAYSVAILLREAMDLVGRHFPAQIFATDLDARAIDVARGGVYPEGIAADITPGRLQGRFVKEDKGYRVKKDIREMVVFAPQNVLEDPPFTRLHLICCRNLLIYLDGTLQRRLLPLFHYALRPGGTLFLGSSESVGAWGDLFSVIDKRWKIFRCKSVPPGVRFMAEFPTVLPADRLAKASGQELGLTRPDGPRLLRLAERALLETVVPPTIIVHAGGEVVHIHGRTGRFLEPAPGPQPTTNILQMARQGLQIELAALIRTVASSMQEVQHLGIRVRTNGGYSLVDATARPIEGPEALRGLIAITLVEREVPSVEEGDADAAGPSADVLGLERELQFTRESHQSTIEQLETTNEELKSTNEELQSTNEELQSANEELETSKEEMQSLNEELQTVNAELQGKIEQLSQANDDMKNLLNGTDIATVFLDDDLHIKRFTQQATEVIHLIPSDVGRSIGDLVSKLRYDQLIADAHDVLRTLVFKEIEVQSEAGKWYLLRILPYRTVDNVIDGLVLTFVDITKLKEAERDLRRAVGYKETVAFATDALVVVDEGLRITAVNLPFCQQLAISSQGTIGELLFDVLPSTLDTQPLREILEAGAAERDDHVALTLSAPAGDRQVLVDVHRPVDDDGVTLIRITSDSPPQESA